jgi:hypothetical protein
MAKASLYHVCVAPKKGDGQAHYELVAESEDEARQQVERQEALLYGSGHRESPFEVVTVDAV